MTTSIDTLAVESSMTVGGVAASVKPQNVVYVQTNPGPGDFSSIKSAIDSITTALISNPFLVKVGPGVYTEDTLTMKPWVWVEGAEINQTIITVNAANKHVVVGADNSGISKCTLNGATASGYAAVYYASLAASQARFIVKDARLGDNDTLAICDSTTAATGLQIMFCKMGGQYPFNKGFVTQGANGSRIVVIALTSHGTFSSPYPSEIFNASGVGAEIVINGAQCRASALISGTAVKISNGGMVRALSLNIKNFAKGIWVENVGSASTLRINGSQIEDCTQDLVIDHPGTTGTFSGSADKSKVVINTSVIDFGVDVTNTGTASGIVNIGPIYQGDRYDRTINLSKLIRNTASLGVASGGVITSTGGLNISVSSGSGFLDNPSDATLEEVSWTTAAILLTANSENYVYVNSAGTVAVQASLPSFYSTILLGRVVTTATGVRFIDSSMVSMEHNGPKTEEYLREYIGPIFKSGSMVTESGTRNLNVSAGHFSYGLTEWLPSGGTGVTWTYAYRDGGAGFIYGTQSQVDNANYDNNAGSLTPLTTGYYAKHSLYLVGSGANEAYFLVYSQVQYATLVEAEQGTIPTPPGTFKDAVTLIATLVVRQGAAAIVQIRDERPRMGFHASGVSASSTHGNLLGLGADDHLQYLLVNGTRAMSGPLNMGGQSIGSVGTVDGVTVSAHASRHLPNGADPLATAAAVSISSNANGVGIANSLAHSDHTHQLTLAAASSDNVCQYNGTNWIGTPPEQLVSAQRAFNIIDDFFSPGASGSTVSAIGDAGWTISVTGGGSTVTQNNTNVTNNHPGIVRLNAGAGAGRSAALLLGAVPGMYVAGGGSLTAEYLINIPTLAIVGADYSIRLGLGDSATADFTNGIYFEYNRAVSVNWLMKTAAAGVRTSTAAAVAVPVGWSRLTIVTNAAASTITYYVNGSSIGTISTNIPTLAIGFVFQVVSITGTVSLFDVDYFSSNQRFTVSR